MPRRSPPGLTEALTDALNGSGWLLGWVLDSGEEPCPESGVAFPECRIEKRPRTGFGEPRRSTRGEGPACPALAALLSARRRKRKWMKTQKASSSAAPAAPPSKACIGSE